MRHKIRQLVLQAMCYTPFEHILRQTYVRISPAKKDKYDRQLVQLMKRALGVHSNCVDVGSYRGEILRDILHVSPYGTHFAFEPIPENHQYLSKKFNHVNIFNTALSDYSGEANFQHVVGRAALSGLCKVTYPDINQEIREIKVSVECLDNIIPKSTRIDFIKIDVEGAELHVLRGGQKLIREYSPIIVFEHGCRKAEIYGTIPEKMYGFLKEECGLNISLMERWLMGNKAFSQEEFCRHVYEGLDFYFVAYPIQATN